MRRIALIVLAALAGCDNVEQAQAPQPAPATPQQKQDAKVEQPYPAVVTAARKVTLPITAVTLYATGVAHVEHTGTVTGDATLELPFKGSQVSSVLKSLLVDDATSAMQATVRPDNAESSSASSSRRVSLSDNPTRVDLLKQLRGAKVRLQVGDDTREVTILSIEDAPRLVKNDKGAEVAGPPAWQINALSGNVLQHIPLDQVKRIELSDPRIQQDLAGALDALWQKENDARTISVQLRGLGERPVRIGYTTDASAWKISYRLALSDKPALQAWASVANTTDNDWNNVQLHLMGGRPMVLGTDQTTDSSAANRASRGSGVPAGESFRRPRPIPSREAMDGMPAGALEETVDAPAIDARDGFRFTLAGVNIPRQSTAMMPVLSDAIAIEPVAVFNESTLRRNALQGARIRNTSKQYLLQGTVTVLEDGRYVGDASLANLAPGRHGLVTWGIDLPVLVDASEVMHGTAIDNAGIQDGLLQVERRHTYARQYLIENEDRKDRTVIVEHPVRRGWQLAEPAQAMEMTETLYRFRQVVPAASKARLVVREQIVEVEGVELASADVETIQSLARAQEISEPVREALGKVLEMKLAVAEQQRQSDRALLEIDRLAAEQARTRRNMEAVGNHDDSLRTQWIQRIEALDKDIQRLRRDINGADEKRETLRREMEASVRRITVARPTRQASATGG